MNVKTSVTQLVNCIEWSVLTLLWLLSVTCTYLTSQLNCKIYSLLTSVMKRGLSLLISKSCMLSKPHHCLGYLIVPCINELELPYIFNKFIMFNIWRTLENLILCWVKELLLFGGAEQPSSSLANTMLTIWCCSCLYNRFQVTLINHMGPIKIGEEHSEKMIFLVHLIYINV